MTVELPYPLPTDRKEARALLDAACLALWGGTEWTKPARKARVMPEGWRQRLHGATLDAHDRRGEAA